MLVDEIDFEELTIRSKVSTRGGGIEISLSPLGYPEESKMTAYQNYLGGGMLGSINNSCNISNWMNVNELLQIAVQLNKYFHSLTNPEEDEWESMSFDDIQKQPKSGY